MSLKSILRSYTIKISKKKSDNAEEHSTGSTNESYSLPVEVYIQFMENLDYRSLLSCMLVCFHFILVRASCIYLSYQVSRLFRDLISGTASLQYIIELAAAGQRDEPLCKMSSTKRLEMLRHHQTSWKDMKWTRDYRIPMEAAGVWELYGGVLGQSTHSGALRFHQLPSDLRSIDEKTWSVGPFNDIPMRDFGMDPSEDLLVIIASINVWYVVFLCKFRETVEDS